MPGWLRTSLWPTVLKNGQIWPRSGQISVNLQIWPLTKIEKVIFLSGMLEWAYEVKVCPHGCTWQSYPGRNRLKIVKNGSQTQKTDFASPDLTKKVQKNAKFCTRENGFLRLRAVFLNFELIPPGGTLPGASLKTYFKLIGSLKNSRKKNDFFDFRDRSDLDFRSKSELRAPGKTVFCVWEPFFSILSLFLPGELYQVHPLRHTLSS